MTHVYEAYCADVAVIGAGHAGCEAALAAARMGCDTVIFAISLDTIALMPCNPSIGGTSKGHLVREIDALGGEMGKNADCAAIQIRMLNASKGVAVRSLRAQMDKSAYSARMKNTLENTRNLRIIQGEVTKLEPRGDEIKVTTRLGTVYRFKTVVICGGTYQKARCLYGEVIIEQGPQGFARAVSLSDCLRELGIRLQRFKTGTPARIDGRTVDFSQMTEQKGDEKPLFFSFESDTRQALQNQLSCYLTYTGEETHRIVRDNLHRAPMYTGVIEGTGTRYCPSIEDKVVRFLDKKSHQVFIEPEGLNTNEMYVAGVSTSLPADVQTALYRTIPGLHNCEITRYAYAIEYDCIDATQLSVSLMFKDIPRLFSAGQINGSSGYEEAAAQGIIAGINAALFLRNEEPLIIGRNEGYIGVLIDDLVIKGTKEPYRMMTSRAEYRLLLRQDNADLRLTEKGYSIGLINEARYKRFVKKRELIESEIKRAYNTVIAPGEDANAVLESLGTAPLTTGTRLSDLIKRPELSPEALAPFDKNRETGDTETERSIIESAREEACIIIKYEGYIQKQNEQVERFKKNEDTKLPDDIDYCKMKGIRNEAVQKLTQLRPQTLGQAMRITGVSPADIAVLTVWLKAYGDGKQNG